MATSDTPTPAKPARPAAKRPSRATAKRAPRAAAKSRTTAAAGATSTSTSTHPARRGARAQELAQRAMLIPVGAALEARDRVAGTVGELVTTTRSRSALERQLDRFERRGDSARAQLEREVRRTRTRIEHGTRSARHGLDRRRRAARKNFDANVELVSDRVENAVQNGVDAGMKLVNGVQDRLPKVV